MFIQLGRTRMVGHGVFLDPVAPNPVLQSSSQVQSEEEGRAGDIAGPQARGTDPSCLMIMCLSVLTCPTSR